MRYAVRSDENISLIKMSNLSEFSENLFTDKQIYYRTKKSSRAIESIDS